MGSGIGESDPKNHNSVTVKKEDTVNHHPVTTRWIHLGESIKTLEELKKHSSDWVAHMNSIVWGEYEAVDWLIANDVLPARFQVEFKRPRRVVTKPVAKTVAAADQKQLSEDEKLKDNQPHKTWEDRVDEDLLNS